LDFTIDKSLGKRKHPKSITISCLSLKMKIITIIFLPTKKCCHVGCVVNAVVVAMVAARHAAATA
jgi:hypothetical protein